MSKRISLICRQHITHAFENVHGLRNNLHINNRSKQYTRLRYEIIHHNTLAEILT